MSNTTKHKIEGKFRNGLISLSKIPLNIYKLWNRHNFDIGYHKKEKQKTKEKIIEKEFQQQMLDINGGN